MYAASKSALAAFSDCLRRELAGTRVSVLHLGTCGEDADLLDLADAAEPDPGRSPEPEAWADRVIRAIADDAGQLGAGERGKRLERFAARSPQRLTDLVAARVACRG